MPFDGFVLKSVIDEISFLINGRIQKITQIGNNEFLFVIRKKTNYKILISTDRNNYRICLTNKEYDTPKEATMFTMLLRKHFEGGIITSIKQFELDRIITITVSKLNEFGDKKEKNIIVELMGKNANLIITNSSFEIIDALRHIGVSENAKIILPKAKYEFPFENKINLFTVSDRALNEAWKKISKASDFFQLFYGFSPLLANYILKQNDPFLALQYIKKRNCTPVIININSLTDFYWFKITEPQKEFKSISEMLENYFYLKTVFNQVEQKTNSLSKNLKHLIQKLEAKIVKLKEEQKVAQNGDKYKQYGQIIMANLYLNKDYKGNSINLLDYNINQQITILLDKRFDLATNAKIYFQKYQKSKNAIGYIKEQIEKSQDEILYLKIILNQLANATPKDIDEIMDELIKEKYLKENKKTSVKRKEKSEITTITQNDTIFFVGKNNLQNEYITHSLAKPNDLWLHVKDAPGSHVVIHKNGDFSEEDIRNGAVLAAYFSPLRDSSSVPVNYTKARFVKKIPGKRNCFVTITNEKTIYIDPSEEKIQKLIK